MSDPRPSDSSTNATEYSVSEISVALKRTVEDAFGNVRVRGEISGYRGPHSSGHAYFALKDERSRLEAVIWKGTFGRLKFLPEEGLEVIASGRLTTYPGSSKYQIVIDSIEPAGAGALMALLEERRRRLAGEGLFDDARKQLLPFMPRVIGVVTSPTGAVIRDIIHRITDRFPLHVLVWPVRVQGDTTGAEVSAAVSGFNALDPAGPVARPDVIIVARGGGSREDLWGFNDEAVVRTVAASDIPVISAVGHETDWTLIDHAADIRAPTPTGAAELAVPVRADLEAQLANLGARLKGGMSRLGDKRRQALRAAARALPAPDQLLALPRRRHDEAAGRLARGLVVSAERKRARLAAIRIQPAILVRRIAEKKRDSERAGTRLPASFARLVAERGRRFTPTAARVAPAALERRIAALGEALRGLERRADRSADAAIERARTRYGLALRLVETLSYHRVLERGFALVRGEDGQPVKRAAEIAAGAVLDIQFADGHRTAMATGVKGAAGTQQRSAARKPGGQGSLF